MTEVAEWGLAAGSPPPGQRSAEGRAARQRAPRNRLGRWNPGARGHDPLRTIVDQNARRRGDLVPIRHGRMAVSPWTYYRGAAAVMAADLASRPDTGLTVQLCGDAHVLNFGLWATPERHLSFDLRDFDETLPGPFEWDVARLVASVVVLAGASGVAPGRAERSRRSAACGPTGSGWRGTPRAGKLDIWYDLITVDQLVARLRHRGRRSRSSPHIEKKARRRTSRGARRKLTERVDGQLRITENPPLRTHLDDTEPALAGEVFAAYRASLPEDRRYLLDRFSFVDVVRQVVGVGSVGMRVYLVLLAGPRQRRPAVPPDQAGRPVGVRAVPAGRSRYANHGQRVVVGQAAASRAPPTSSWAGPRSAASTSTCASSAT